jgi:hypothetical protein
MTTLRDGPGAMLLVTRRADNKFVARLCAVPGSFLSRACVIQTRCAGLVSPSASTGVQE